MEHKTIWGGIPKKLVRISDGADFGGEMTLGFTHYLGGKKLDTPLWELEEHFKRVEVPLEDLRLNQVYYDESDGTPYTIVAFTEEGKPIYKEGIHEVEVPEGYWEQFEPQPVEEEFMTQEELEESVNEGDIIETSSGEKLRCVGFDNGEPMWEMVE